MSPTLNSRVTFYSIYFHTNARGVVRQCRGKCIYKWESKIGVLWKKCLHHLLFELRLIARTCDKSGITLVVGVEKRVSVKISWEKGWYLKARTILWRLFFSLRFVKSSNNWEKTQKLIDCCRLGWTTQNNFPDAKESFSFPRNEIKQNLFTPHTRTMEKPRFEWKFTQNWNSWTEKRGQTLYLWRAFSQRNRSWLDAISMIFFLQLPSAHSTHFGMQNGIY